MDIQKIQQYKTAFDQIAKTVKDDDDNAKEIEQEKIHDRFTREI
jgi:hypothetical protein